MNYFNQLKEAINYAVQTGSFSKYNICKSSKNVCIFGTGTFFNNAFFHYNMRQDCHVNLLCDNDSRKWGSSIYNLPVVSPEKLATYDDLIVIPLIGARKDLKKVEQQLTGLGLTYLKAEDLFFESICNMERNAQWFSKSQKILETLELLADEESKRIYTNVLCNRIASHLANYNFWEMFSDGEYFATGVFQLTDSENFVDCGAYKGDSIEKFLSVVNHKFSNIYGFELDGNNFLAMRERLQHINQENIHLYNYGVYSETGDLTYGKEDEGSAESFSLLKNDNLIRAKVVKLDDKLKDKAVTLIKMDIEGAELDALKGAENIIKEQRPKLAICLYHRLEDFWRIPMYLKSIVPEYKFSVRHHQYGTMGGTVLYAYQ